MSLSIMKTDSTTITKASMPSSGATSPKSKDWTSSPTGNRSSLVSTTATLTAPERDRPSATQLSYAFGASLGKITSLELKDPMEK